MNEITKEVSGFYDSMDAPNHRYKSWEHCHHFFRRLKEKRIDNGDLDLAQLHLAFYLASWGMYRGSSFILQKDYNSYKEIVKIVLDEKYNLLWDIGTNRDNPRLQELFLNLYQDLYKEILKIKKSIEGHKDLIEKKRGALSKERVSEILVTKIILGTIGCIPAYDRFFKEGLKQKKKIQKFNERRSLVYLLEFYKEHLNEINTLSRKYNYTPMKIIDMYFWSIGYNVEKDKNETQN